MFCLYMSEFEHKALYDFEHFVYGFEQTLTANKGQHMLQQTGSILIVDDDEDILVAVKLLLKRHFDTVITCSNPDDIPVLMKAHVFDAILLDMNFGPGESSGQQGFLWLGKILAIDPRAIVIMITAHGGVNVAVEAMKQGATDFVAKPWQNEKLVATLSTSVKLRRTRSEADKLKKTNKTLAAVASEPKQPILGNSPAIAEVLSVIARTAPTDANVLVLGENGTGKELVARELHRLSKRSENIFMAVDLGAVPETLFESELFGHKKGAFTDAREDRIGRLQAADGGTLFLDEIGNLPLHLQAKLLTVLETRQVVPVGSGTPIAVDIRVIAATNVALDKLKDDSIFRQDLLFRLNTVEVHVPPLRDRRQDIPEIARHYCALYCRKYDKPEKEFAPDALSAMTHYSWPGNVRALRHAIERAVILSDSDAFTADDFQMDPSSVSGPPATQSPIGNRGQAGSDVADSSDLNLERIEKSAIAGALKKHRYNISHAAKELGITRAALYRRMEKHGL